MDHIDLDINNYELNDILNLFKISSNFTEEDLKKCKKQVLMTHPDKSKLSKEYFLFFSKAYKILYEIHTFKENSNKDTATEYTDVLVKNERLTNDKEKKSSINKFIKRDDFNKEFNKLFEKNNVKNEHDKTGYGDFLKSDIDDNIVNELYNGTVPQNERLQKLETLREKSRALILRKDVQSTNAYSIYTDISNSAPQQYSSEIFSSLPYEDLKKAHTETLIPVTSEDARKEQFSSIHEIQQHRQASLDAPLSLQQANRFLAEKADRESRDATNRAYRLARQSEIASQIQKNFDSHFNRITN